MVTYHSINTKQGEKTLFFNPLDGRLKKGSSTIYVNPLDGRLKRRKKKREKTLFFYHSLDPLSDRHKRERSSKKKKKKTKIAKTKTKENTSAKILFG